MKFELLLILALAGTVFTQTEDCLECLDDDIEPVCGLDGVTYINECQLEECSADDNTIAYYGPCKCNCRADPVDPVCGSDGMTYRNRCAAECAKATIQYAGRCSAFGQGAGGNCNCVRQFELVCGVDGRTYESRCDAQCYGVQVAYRHPCYT